MFVANWEGTGKWKMWFNNGGAIDFGRAMLQAGRLGMLSPENVLRLIKVGVLCSIQQPISYWDTSSDLSLVGVEPTQK